MTKTVACLAGDGVGPELMAAATRALERVAKLRAEFVAGQLERPSPFGGDRHQHRPTIVGPSAPHDEGAILELGDQLAH